MQAILSIFCLQFFVITIFSVSLRSFSNRKMCRVQFAFCSAFLPLELCWLGLLYTGGYAAYAANAYKLISPFLLDPSTKNLAAKIEAGAGEDAGKARLRQGGCCFG